MGGSQIVQLGFSVFAVLVEVVLDAPGGLLTVPLGLRKMLACVGLGLEKVRGIGACTR